MMKGRRVWCSVIALMIMVLCGGCAPRVNGKEQGIDLNDFQAARQPWIRITAIAISTHFPVPLSQRDFDEEVMHDGDYLLEIRDQETARRVGRVISEMELVANPDGLNCRYRIQFYDAEKLVMTLHAGQSGDITYRGIDLRSPHGAQWLRDIWTVIGESLIPAIQK